jgi:hypothetical protein
MGGLAGHACVKGLLDEKASLLERVQVLADRKASADRTFEMVKLLVPSLNKLLYLDCLLDEQEKKLVQAMYETVVLF